MTIPLTIVWSLVYYNVDFQGFGFQRYKTDCIPLYHVSVIL